MIGLARAEWLRLRKRRSLQVILLAVPLLVGATFFLGYNSIYQMPPFDEGQFRADMLTGIGEGVPPDQLQQMLDEAVQNERGMYAQQEASTALIRATYVFPNSLVQALGSGTFVLLALILLTATTVGDEFGWGTIRTSLLASSRRPSFLLVRVGAVAVAGLVIFALLLLLGAVLPLFLNIPASKLPPTLPAFDVGALAVLLAGELVASLAVIAFAALITLLMRNGALTLVSVLVYVAIEAAVLTLLTRFDNLGDDHWLLDAFPLHGLTTMLQVVGRAATGLPGYPGEAVSRDVGVAAVPIVSFGILALTLGGLAFRRFRRMDIVE
jgi:ABC-type transport system involved in multi-copper enzyme maturation permease subunit